MVRALSDDLRGRVLSAVAGGLSARAAARRFGVGASTAIAWADRRRCHGETSARRQGKPRGSRLDAHKDFILGLIKERADITLAEMAGKLAAERQVHISAAMLCVWLKRSGMTYKKRRRTPPSKTDLTS